MRSVWHICLFPAASLLAEDPAAAGETQAVDTICEGLASERLAPGLLAYVREAAHRFLVPECTIMAVIGAESGGDVSAVSPKGAMGLMQIIPRTWTELSIRYGLGSDPFDGKANIVGGTAYLRELRDRFGDTGSIAAYNAGPERYRQHLERGLPLPKETIKYVARVQALIGRAAERLPAPTHALGSPGERGVPLFVHLSGSSWTSDTCADDTSRHDCAPIPSSTSADTLFVGSADLTAIEPRPTGVPGSTNSRPVEQSETLFAPVLQNELP